MNRPEYDTLGKWDNSQWYEDNGTEFLPNGIIPGHTYYYKVRADGNDIYFIYGSFESCEITGEGTATETVGPPRVLTAVKLSP